MKRNIPHFIKYELVKKNYISITEHKIYCNDCKQRLPYNYIVRHYFYFHMNTIKFIMSELQSVFNEEVKYKI